MPLIGSIQLIHGLFAHRFTPNILKGWRTSAAEAGAGVIDNSALHLVDLLTSRAAASLASAQEHPDRGRRRNPPLLRVHHGDGKRGDPRQRELLSPANSVQEEISIYGSCGSLSPAASACNGIPRPPPMVCYKSSGGTVLKEFDLSELPSGKTLPLLAMIDVLQGRAGLETLHTEASQTLETHRVMR